MPPVVDITKVEFLKEDGRRYWQMGGGLNM
jgi:hypothetical protein